VRQAPQGVTDLLRERLGKVLERVNAGIRERADVRDFDAQELRQSVILGFVFFGLLDLSRAGCATANNPRSGFVSPASPSSTISTQSPASSDASGSRPNASSVTTLSATE
jgi:hypothetical protein